MERTKEEIEREIINFLDEHSSRKAEPSDPHGGVIMGTTCALGTCRDNIPRVTPIDFYHDGLTLWMIGDPGGKLANICSNPNVSVAIYTQLESSKENRSITLRGKANLVTYRKQKDIFMDVITKLGILDLLKKVIRSGVSKKRPDLEIDHNADFETQLEKLMNYITMIKVEPELMTLLILPPGGVAEGAGVRLVWEKEG